MFTRGNIQTIALIICGGVLVLGIAMYVFDINTTSYAKDISRDVTLADRDHLVENTLPEKRTVTHQTMPDAVKGIYMSSWVASTPHLREKLVDLIDTTELNAVVIDIKDSTGKVSFVTDNAFLQEVGSLENRIKDLPEFIEHLHEKNIYVIGRISVFQDPFLAVQRPELSLRKKSDGTVWKDKKGLSFLDPQNKYVWEYIVTLAKESYAIGFDEINFDYIRFPSDGNIADIQYGLDDTVHTRAEIIEQFFAHVRSELHNDELHIPMSADLFGMTTTSQDDLGIGQVLEKAMPHFDAIAPMIYPSHYPKNWNNYANPAEKPFEVITDAMKSGNARAVQAGYTADIFRPWIQDFNLGATYTADKVRAQIKALDALGIDSWLVWDPGNSYTTGAFLAE